MGTFKPSIVDTKVSQITGSKASLADVVLMVQSHERGFQKISLVLVLSTCSSNQFISTRRVESTTLREVKLVLFLETCAYVSLTQDLEGCPILGELLRDTSLGRDDWLREILGLLVLRAESGVPLGSLRRHQGGHLTLLECQMKSVELL
jgi:hypothetical protein